MLRPGDLRSGDLRLGDCVRHRAAPGWERSVHHRGKTAPPRLVWPQSCVARRRNGTAWCPDFTLCVHHGNLVFCLHTSTAGYKEWQVCGGVTWLLEGRPSSDLGVRRYQKQFACGRGLWQQVRLHERWWPLARETMMFTEGLGSGGAVRDLPKARRRRPVPYMRGCEAYEDERIYHVKCGLLAYERVHRLCPEELVLYYKCPYTGEQFGSDATGTIAQYLPFL